MIIARLDTFTTRALCLVKVTSDDGHVGWGQCAPFNADITATVFHRQVAPVALGADAFDLETLSRRVIEANYKFPWSYVCRGLAGLDTACWDLRGRLEGRSVCELLGGVPRPFPVYGSSMRRDISPADEAARLVRLRDELGYTAFKLRVGSVCGHDQDESPGRTEALIETVRRSVGDAVRLLVDGNSCYSPARAIEVGRRLEAFGYVHFEEPCPWWELEQTAEVAAALDIDVAGGEQDNDLAQWRRMIGMRAVDLVQPDVCYLGGLTRSLEVARMAAAAGLKCVPHSANPSLVTVYALHLMGAIENAGDYVEFSIEPSGWTDGLFTPPLRCVDGMVQIPDGPGWGVEPSESWLAAAERQSSAA